MSAHPHVVVLHGGQMDGLVMTVLYPGNSVVFSATASQPRLVYRRRAGQDRSAEVQHFDVEREEEACPDACPAG